MYDSVEQVQREMLDQEDAILSDARDYQTQVQNAYDQTEEMRVSVLDTMSSIESVEDSRSVAFAIFFMVPMILLILGVCAFVKGGSTGRNMFKLTYCCAFLLATVTWILFGVFNITVTLWADTCVRLDVMEDDIPGSTLLNQVYTSETIKDVIDACLNGKYLPDAFNVSDSLDFKTLETDIVSQLTVDLVSAFNIDSLNSYENFVATMNQTNYEATVNEYIFAYNQQFNPNPPVSRDVLGGNTGSFVVDPTDQQEVTAYAALQRYYDVERANIDGAIKDHVVTFKSESDDMFKDIRALELFSIYTLQANLTAIKCSLDPIFNQADILLYGNETAWCNQVGQMYGNMKEKGCQDLFLNFEYTNRSLLVVAIFSMFIGILAVTLGRRIDRQFNLFAAKTFNFGNQNLELGQRH